MNRFVMFIVIAALTYLFFSTTVFAQTLDVCRVDYSNKTTKSYCQHWRAGKKQQTRLRSKMGHDRWMAVPCRQLKKMQPELDCGARLGEVRLGEVIEK